VIKEKD